MCGIVGFFGGGDKKRLQAMLDAIVHRGPDDQGFFIENKVGLGSNRLAIIDLSAAGRQPIFDDSRSVCIVFNGEIYNFQELRKRLELKYHFKTKTDTEVLLYAYKEWGVNCLQRINGMFSFVIYDRSKDLLFGARDRLGEKPLKYYFDGNVFAFASEIKGLLPFLKSKPLIDPVAINHYLTLQYVNAPRTGFKNIFKLPPGHYFILKNNKLQIKQYWNISFNQKLLLTEEEWEEVLLEKLKESVKSRLISDVPLGVFLSGGVDSSAIVALMSQVSNQKIKTFTISFEEKKFDESEYADLIAKQYQSEHRSFKVTSKIMGDIFTKLADFYDEPFADNSSIPTLVLSKLAGKYVKVALTGDGGDENFAGYDRYNVVSFSNFYNNVPQSGRSLISQGSDLANMLISTKLSRRTQTYTQTFELPFYKKYLYYSCFFNNETKYKLYTADFFKTVKKADTFEIFRSLNNNKISDLDNALKIDIASYLPEDLLFKTDIASMAYSLETRSPFLNHELVELTAKIPPELKIKFFNKKYIFKKILTKYNLMPKEIIQRKKRGFTSPIDKWMKEDYKEFVLSSLTSTKFKSSNIFDQKKLEEYLKSYFTSKTNEYNNIYALLVLSQWINKYF